MIGQQLRIESGGRAANSYRLNGRRLEVKVDSGEQARNWEPLSQEEILLHLNLNTVVAKWAEKRCPWLVQAMVAKLAAK